MRAPLAGLVAFALALLVLGTLLGALDAPLAAGAAAAVLGGAAGGAAGAWQARAMGLRGGRSLLAATLGPVLGALVLVAATPQASLATLAGLLAVTAGALGAAFASLAR
jgi:hypothetical protein